MYIFFSDIYQLIFFQNYFHFIYTAIDIQFQVIIVSDYPNTKGGGNVETEVLYQVGFGHRIFKLRVGDSFH